MFLGAIVLLLTPAPLIGVMDVKGVMDAALLFRQVTGSNATKGASTLKHLRRAIELLATTGVTQNATTGTNGTNGTNDTQLMSSPFGVLHDLLENQIQPAIVDAHRTDQVLINDSAAAVKEILRKYNTRRGLLQSKRNTLNTTLVQLENATGTLRVRKGRFDDKVVALAEAVQKASNYCCMAEDICPNEADYCDVFTLSKAYVGCNYELESAAVCWANAERLIDGAISFFKERSAKYIRHSNMCTDQKRNVRDKHLNVSFLAAILRSDVQIHNDSVADYTGLVTAYLREEANVCEDAKTKYPAAVSAFHNLTETVYSAAQDREAQWNATLTIKCMIGHFMRNESVQEEQVVQCAADVTPLGQSIIYPRIPEGPSRNHTCVPTDLSSAENLTWDFHVPPTNLSQCDTREDAEPEIVEAGDCPQWCQPEQS